MQVRFGGFGLHWITGRHGLWFTSVRVTGYPGFHDCPPFSTSPSCRHQLSSPWDTNRLESLTKRQLPKCLPQLPRLLRRSQIRTRYRSQKLAPASVLHLTPAASSSSHCATQFHRRNMQLCGVAYSSRDHLQSHPKPHQRASLRPCVLVLKTMCLLLRVLGCGCFWQAISC